MKKRALWEQVFWHGIALAAGTLTLLGLVRACETESRAAVPDLVIQTHPDTGLRSACHWPRHDPVVVETSALAL